MVRSIDDIMGDIIKDIDRDHKEYVRKQKIAEQKKIEAARKFLEKKKGKKRGPYVKKSKC